MKKSHTNVSLFPEFEFDNLDTPSISALNPKPNRQREQEQDSDDSSNQSNSIFIVLRV